MNKKQYEAAENTLPKGIGCFNRMTDKEKQLYNELRCVDMLDSILTYSNGKCSIDNNYLQSYINDLGEARVKELMDEQVEHYRRYVVIHHNVHTDSEGLTYNSTTDLGDYDEPTCIGWPGKEALVKACKPKEKTRTKHIGYDKYPKEVQLVNIEPLDFASLYETRIDMRDAYAGKLSNALILSSNTHPGTLIADDILLPDFRVCFFKKEIPGTYQAELVCNLVNKWIDNGFVKKVEFY